MEARGSYSGPSSSMISKPGPMEDLVPLMGWLCRRRDRAAGRGSGSLAATGPESCDERLDDLVLTIVDDFRDDT